MVSVIIPTYNRACVLKRAVDSVLRQSYRDLELIIVDDGSQDRTAELVSFIHDDRLRYLVQQNRGAANARNQGVWASKGEWISFLDSDDAWLPGKLQRQIASLAADPRYRVNYTNEIWIRNGVRVNQRKKHRKFGGWIYPFCLPLCLISPSSALLHRSIFESEKGFDESYPVCEDYELWLRLTARYPVQFLDEPLIYKYGGHQDQLSRSRWGLDIFRIRALTAIFRTGRLRPYFSMLTAREIVRKARILVKGFSNRGNRKQAEYYRRLEAEYLTHSDANPVRF